MQNVTGVPIKDCEFAVHCTKSFHSNFLAGIDKFPAEFKSIVAYFEIYDGVRMLFFVIIGDEESTREPQKIMGLLHLYSREFLKPIAVQSMQTHRLVQTRICHRDERVAATSRGEPVVFFWHLDAVEARNGRAALHTEQLDILREPLAEEYS